jgi:SAM-dependent methyltransferase
MLGRIKNRLIHEASRLIIGIHPHNTVFSFNYTNIRHVREFMKSQAVLHDLRNKILVDVGGGKIPYRNLFDCGRYIAIDLYHILPTAEGNTEFINSPAENLPLADASVDLVICNQVMEHVNDPLRTLSEIHRILRPGGIFLGSVPHISPVHLEPYDFRRYTDLGLQQVLEVTGFRNTEITGSGGVFSAAALLLSMDWMLSRRKPDKAQDFSVSRALLLSPIVGLMNMTALLLDAVLPDSGRSPANLCWRAEKP